MIFWQQIRRKAALAPLFVILVLCFATSARAEAESSRWTPLLQGAELAVHGRWDQAQARLERVPAQARSAEVTTALALAHLAQGRAKRARPLLDAATSAKATLAEAHFWAGVADLRLNRPRQAVASFDVAVSLRSDRPEYRLGRALARAASGDRDAALGDLVAAAKARPNLLEPAYHPDERRGMIRVLERGLETFPAKAPAEDAILRLFFKAGLMREARDRASGRRSAAAWEILGRLASHHGREAEAERLLAQAVARDTTSAEARFHLGRVTYARGASRRALKILREAADLAPSDPRIQIALGDLYLEGGELARAELAYDYALSRGPSPRAFVGLGRTLELRGDLEGARRSYEKALRMAPASVDVLERLARLLERSEPVPPAAGALRRRLAKATELESAFESRVKTLTERLRGHAAACELLATDPAAAEARLRRDGLAEGGARAFALIAASALAGGEDEAEVRARAFLKTLPARRWAAGASPSLVVRQRLGSAVIVRVALMDYAVY